MTADAYFDDPWHLQPQQPSPAPGDPTASPLHIDHIGPITPLDPQQGVVLKKSVPDALHAAFFGQPAPSGAEVGDAGGPDAVPPLQTYAILDAAKVTNLPELLERAGLEHCCLFNGKAYDDLKNVAPWLVRLDEGSGFCRNLFTDSSAHWHLWAAEPGIYLRSRGTPDAIRRHFRKFTRLRDSGGNWYYFRFWEPAHFCAFLAGAQAATLHHMFGGALIAEFLVIRRQEAVRFWLDDVARLGEAPRQRPILDEPTMRLFSVTAETLLLERLYARLSSRRPLSEADFARIIRAIDAQGFASREVVTELADWMALRDLTTLGDEWVAASLHESRDLPEAVRFARLVNDEPMTKGSAAYG